MFAEFFLRRRCCWHFLGRVPTVRATSETTATQMKKYADVTGRSLSEDVSKEEIWFQEKWRKSPLGKLGKKVKQCGDEFVKSFSESYVFQLHASIPTSLCRIDFILLRCIREILRAASWSQLVIAGLLRRYLCLPMRGLEVLHFALVKILFSLNFDCQGLKKISEHYQELIKPRMAFFLFLPILNKSAWDATAFTPGDELNRPAVPTERMRKRTRGNDTMCLLITRLKETRWSSKDLVHSDRLKDSRWVLGNVRKSRK